MVLHDVKQDRVDVTFESSALIIFVLISVLELQNETKNIKISFISRLKAVNVSEQEKSVKTKDRKLLHKHRKKSHILVFTWVNEFMSASS